MLKTIGLAFVFTFLGKILAFFRVQQLAYNYGQDYWLDAFFIVFSFASMFDVVLISGAIATTFIPNYLKSKSKSLLAAEILYSQLYISLVIIFALISAAIFISSNCIAQILIKGENSSLIHAVSSLLKTFSTFPLFSLLFQFPTIYNQANRNFQLSTLNPILLNGLQLVCIVFLTEMSFSTDLDVTILALLYLATMLFCYFIQTNFYKPAKIRIRGKLSIQSVSLFSVSLIPFIIFISIEEMNLLVDQYFATSLVEGSVANLLFASRLVKIFGAIMVASVITVFYPRVSSLMAKGKNLQMIYVSKLIINFLCVVTIPIVIIFYTFAEQIVVFLYGENVDVNVAEALSYYSFLVFTNSIYMIQLRLVYSMGIDKRILFFCLLGALANFGFNSFLIEPLGISGLALSTVLVSFIQVVLFEIYLRIKDIYLFTSFVAKTTLVHSIVIAITFMAVNITKSFSANQFWVFDIFLILVIYFTFVAIWNQKLFKRLMKI